MRFKSGYGLFSIATVGVVAAIAACSQGDSGTQSTVTVSETTQPAAVVLSMFSGKTSTPSGTCSGTLISPKLVLTAGHCVAGKVSWKVSAPNAGNQTAAGVRAFTYDWRNYKSNKSHPNNHDIALLELDRPISLESYPTISDAPASEGALLSRVRRAPEAAGLSKTRLQMASVLTQSGKSVGFEPYYVAASENNEVVDTGGALIDPKTNTIYGVISGRGNQSGRFYIARTDAQVARGWAPSSFRSYSKAAPSTPKDISPVSGRCYGNCSAFKTSESFEDSPFPSNICDGGSIICLPDGSFVFEDGGPVPPGTPTDGGNVTYILEDGGTSTTPPGSGGGPIPGDDASTPSGKDGGSSTTNDGGGPGGNGSGNGDVPDGTNPGGQSGGSANEDGTQVPGSGSGSGSRNNSDCDGPECGGCDELNLSCVDDTKDYGDSVLPSDSATRLR